MQCVWINLSWNIIPISTNSPIHLVFITSFSKPLYSFTKRNACEIGRAGNQEFFFSSDFILNFQKNWLPLYIVDLIISQNINGDLNGMLLLRNGCTFWILCRWISLWCWACEWERVCVCVICVVCSVCACVSLYVLENILWWEHHWRIIGESWITTMQGLYIFLTTIHTAGSISATNHKYEQAIHFNTNGKSFCLMTSSTCQT